MLFDRLPTAEPLNNMGTFYKTNLRTVIAFNIYNWPKDLVLFVPLLRVKIQILF